VSEAVLIVEDEPDLRLLVAHNLREAGFAVRAVGTGAEALEAASSTVPAVVILDLGLPDLDGVEVCRRLRAEPALADLAVMMLTARDEMEDRVDGFTSGTDDYMGKPFDIGELVVRVRALARFSNERRRSHGVAREGDRLRWHGVEMECAAHRVFVDGVEVPLGPVELALLRAFFEQPGRVLTRTQLLQIVWPGSEQLTPRSLDVPMKRLRDRLGPYGHVIETVPGFGYRLRQP
jgi:DNA-binding response OmpR family regulator